MSRVTPVFSTARKLRDIRNRALTYAEHFFYSRMQLAQQVICYITQDEWELQVREIELHLMCQEEPSLVAYELQNYNSLQIFFDKSFHNVIHFEVV